MSSDATINENIDDILNSDSNDSDGDNNTSSGHGHRKKSTNVVSAMDWKRAVDNVKSMYRLRKDYVNKNMQKIPTQDRSDDATYRFERRVNPGRPFFMGTGAGVKRKIIKSKSQFASNKFLRDNFLSVTNKGTEISSSSVLHYKWQTVQFINNLNINMLCSIRISDELIEISDPVSVIDYLITLIFIVSLNIKKKVTIFDNSILTFKHTVSKIMTFDFPKNAPIKSNKYTRVYCNGKTKHTTVYPELYKNAIACQLNMLTSITNTNSTSAKTAAASSEDDDSDNGCVDENNINDHDALFDLMCDSYLRDRYELIKYLDMQKINKNWIYQTMKHINNNYTPSVEIQILCVRKPVENNPVKFAKIRKNETMPLDSDYDSDNSSSSESFDSIFVRWSEQLNRFNNKVAYQYTFRPEHRKRVQSNITANGATRNSRSRLPKAPPVMSANKSNTNENVATANVLHDHQQPSTSSVYIDQSNDGLQSQPQASTSAFTDNHSIDQSAQRLKDMRHMLRFSRNLSSICPPPDIRPVTDDDDLEMCTF